MRRGVSADHSDRFDAARSVADAVLYEGYVLYPYRASSRKNQVRFQWGVLTPRAFSEADGSERWSVRSECLLDARRDAELTVRVRCLQTQHRRVEASLEASDHGDAAFEPVTHLEVDGTMHVEWDEAVDQVVDLHSIAVPTNGVACRSTAFAFDAHTVHEEIRTAEGRLAGRFVRRRQPVQGLVHVTTERPDAGTPYVKVSVSVENTTPCVDISLRRDDVMGHSLVAVHTMVAVDGGRFISLLDPPDDATGAVAACHSEGLYPVLIGDEDLVLASPIILYDHPEVAPQSPGDLYDSLEIDEILALRVMTLTDEEKSEARGTDQRAAAIIDRCDDMSAETLSRLHGQMKAVDPVAIAPGYDEHHDRSPIQWWDPEVDAAVDPWTDTLLLSGVVVTKGTPVRLRPSQHSDAQDMFLDGLTATVAGVFKDVDGDAHIAVTLDDDPASAELVWQGRFLFFHPDEVEPLVDQEQRP